MRMLLHSLATKITNFKAWSSSRGPVRPDSTYNLSRQKQKGGAKAGRDKQYNKLTCLVAIKLAVKVKCVILNLNTVLEAEPRSAGAQWRFENKMAPLPVYEKTRMFCVVVPVERALETSTDRAG